MIEADRVEMSYSEVKERVLFRVFENDEATDPLTEFVLVGRAGAALAMMIRHQGEWRDHEYRHGEMA